MSSDLYPKNDDELFYEIDDSLSDIDSLIRADRKKAGAKK